MLQQKRQEMDEAIVVIERLAQGESKRPGPLPSPGPKTAKATAGPHGAVNPSKRKITAAGLKRMSEASKKRWAEHRKTAKAATAVTRPSVARKEKPKKGAV